MKNTGINYYTENINWLQRDDVLSTLPDSKIGLEKETLRVGQEGKISQLPHPESLGSALTHSYITTDYSESLTEFITPPLNSIQEALTFLNNTQKFVYDKLDNEILWATSMPCVVAGETSIPIAEYGSSNAGKMKTVYRKGLGHRYGRVMQVIAGVHFNYSLGETFWNKYQKHKNNKDNLQDFISEQYFSLLRNLLRNGWVIPYLFGASPAVCKSFLGGQSTNLEHFDVTTYYHPYATSLRMGDIGYQNNKENESGVKADYSSLDDYVNSLKSATETPYSGYVNIGVTNKGEYQQLNTHILQIENEYYSTVRPKQILISNEKPSLALKKRGVQYIELRSLDVNAFEPSGINEEQMYFIEAFILFCLLQESPNISNQEQIEIDHNEIETAHYGRKPGLTLLQHGEKRLLTDWGVALCDDMESICASLDTANQTTQYSRSLKIQRAAFIDSDKTPSARMLQDMKNRDEGFYHFALRLSQQHKMFFDNYTLNKNEVEFYNTMVNSSIEKQKEIEASDSITFEHYLENYFSQT
ncbi:MAG: glutamate--cysteine ligase [Gammaproteobacteria bacterium]